MSDQYPDEVRLHPYSLLPPGVFIAEAEMDAEAGEPYVRASIHDNIMSGVRAQMRAEIKATAEHHNALNEANMASADQRIAELEAAIRRVYLAERFDDDLAEAAEAHDALYRLIGKEVVDSE